MDTMNLRSIVLATILLTLALTVSAEVQGKIKLTCLPDPNNICLCSGSNVTFDLGAAFVQKTSWNISEKDPNNPNNTIVLSPCVDYKCGGTSSRACEYSTNGGADHKSGGFKVVGSSEVLWEVLNATKFVVNFTHGAAIYNNKLRLAYVTCNVDPTKKTPEVTYDGQGDPNDPSSQVLPYKFTVTAASFAPLPNNGGGTAVGVIGIVIIVLLLVGLAAYFIIGSIVMYGAKGARGAEMIPNYTFWKDLPFLIKDGSVFTYTYTIKLCVDAIENRNYGGYNKL